MTRFFHAFKWQTVVDVIKERTKGIVLIASPSGDGDKQLLARLTPEENKRVIGTCAIYDDDETQAIIYAAHKPSDKTWVDWLDSYEGYAGGCFEELEKCADALSVAVLVLIDHPNRTKNLHTILAETTLKAISSTEKHVNRPAGKNRDGEETVERVPNV